MDTRTSPAAPPKTIRREDYRQPDWIVPDVALDFDLGAERTVVRARLEVRRQAPAPLVLDGDGLVPVAVRVDGQATEAWRLDGGALVLDLPGDAHVVETEVALSPQTNTQLMGLYASGGLLCTQCEAEGFRRITFFPDRPDVLSRYRVRLVADKARYPVLLSNGDLVGSGDLDDGRHFAEWHDPFPKPSYLFAAVAGDLAERRDSFTTASGRTVQLGIWTRAEDRPRTAHAMESLKLSMAWDERVYGREYDLGIFNIVAVNDFNFGAMENKGLNIFNTRYILADPDEATDSDYDGIAAVVAHEYFHNWSGNRVTCRDWFQLSLKEGFTVFRDQGFSADLGSPAVRRIEDVRALRATQFPEDAGPLAHPVRPESYMEISNFYTATIYNKGAELIRMIHTLVGPGRFRQGSDLYFERHDGEAATCEDFVVAMEVGAQVDLTAFRRWYGQAGTPRVEARIARVEDGTVSLALRQSTPPTPGQPDKSPVPIPLRTALFDRASGARLAEQLVLLEDAEATVALGRAPGDVALSINRGFSAPIVLVADRATDELAFLAAHDDDPFARYEAVQGLMLEALVDRVASGDAGGAADAAVDAVGAMLADPALDDAFVAEAALLPSESFIGDQMLVVEPLAIHDAREWLRARIGRAHLAAWRERQERGANQPFAYTPEAKGRRRLRGVALAYLLAARDTDAAARALDQFQRADNMTDRFSALSALVGSDAAERETALDAFRVRHGGSPLVLDKWFGVQAGSSRSDTLETVVRLSRDPDFTLANPNRARALIGGFGANQLALHDDGGAGYRFLADQILQLDRLNPQTAARLVPPLGRWRRFGEARAAAMRAQLERMLRTPGLSRDLYEQVFRSID
ncbi:aminopeptidase N [Sphingomonas jejuensis]|uniref:Aminopeptidase N n=1 Tax=Sphingomonas jejuensis TaxID=904715 RepID=A0ABX0XKX7_9SPHN|nr:aminopeptidase N [Sphingomonas jejuensis]NJC34017.1 aminopeptidase N [Sphingomonas jejuensis]